MNCDEARRHWSLYHDSEGDAELYFQINEHLAGCPDCAQWFHQHSRLEDLLAERLGPAESTPQLWQSVLAGSGLQRPAPTRRWFFFGSLLAVAATLLVAVGVWFAWKAADGIGGFTKGPDLARLTAEIHERFVSGEAKPEFRSESDLKVENYLQRRVSFQVRCPPRKDTGFLVEGAGVSKLDGQEAAYVLGHVEGRPVAVFILARESLQRFPHQWEALRRERVHRCREVDQEMVMAEIDRNVVLVVGRTDEKRLLRVLNAYGTYPHNNS